MSPEQIANIVNQKMKEAEAAYNEKAKAYDIRVRRCYLDYFDSIKPCPFCGCGSGTLFIHHNNYECFWIACCESDFGCGATGPEYPTPEGACEAWNERSCKDEI